MISQAFAAALKTGRYDFNARFAEARRQFPGLSGDEFGTFLKTAVDEIIAAVAAAQPERTTETVSVAYDVALELVGQGLVGSQARQTFLEDGLRRILPAAAPCVAEAPARILPAVGNALHYLTKTSGARPAQWIHDMVRMATLCRSVAEFLKCGQVAAWHAGLAHFRAGALVAANTLPESTAKAALDIPPSADWKTIIEHLNRDPWFDPGTEEGGKSDAHDRLRLVRRVGAFRGFGGLFPEPPRAAVFGENFLVSSGDNCWLLVADLFGATFHRADPAEFHEAVRRGGHPHDVAVSGTTVSRNGVSLNLAELCSFTSAAANRHTLALTSPLTHAVMLVALT